MSNRHPLSEWLADHGVTHRDLARGIDVTEATVSRIVNAHSAPNQTTIDAILAYCRGIDPGVTYESLFQRAA